MTLVTIGFSDPLLFVNFFLSFFPLFGFFMHEDTSGGTPKGRQMLQEKPPTFLGSTVVRELVLSWRTVRQTLNN